MSKIASIDFQDENVKKDIRKRYFTKIECFHEKQTEIDEITESPIVQELYFRDEFKEITDPERLGKELLEQGEKQEVVLQENEEEILPIAKECIQRARDIAETRIARNVAKISKEVKTAYLEIENPNQNRETGKEDI